MPSIYTTIGPWTLQTFTLVMAVAILASAAVGVYRARVESGVRALPSAGAAADTYLGALIGGVVLARLGHVLLSWDYFSANLTEIWHLELGGLNWHGAVIGGLIGLRLAARLRHTESRHLLDALTLGLPLLGIAGWWGCLASACGYGAEVPTLYDHPAFAVGEYPDIFGIVAPRYNTQVLGMLLSMTLLGLAVLLVGCGWMRLRRFWLVLALLSAGMFVIGFFRGDSVTMALGLRLDQWFDAGLLVVGVWRLVKAQKRN